MKDNSFSEKKRKAWIRIIVLCITGLLINLAFSRLALILGLPLYLDNIGTILTAALGGFIPGIRPGKPTADYLKKVSNRITLFGAIYLAIVALVPSVVFKAIGGDSLVNVFSATGLLIVVSVALEFDQALTSQIMMKNYKGFLK